MSRKIPIDPEIAGLVIKEQIEAFRRKFGHEMGPQDPLFFDPDADLPLPISDANHDQLVDEMTALMDEAGIHPAHIYAFRKTGRMVSEENRDRPDPAELREWHSALRAYERKADRENKAIERCFLLRARAGGKKAGREGIPAALIESMSLRSWLRMRVVNDRRSEEFFQRLDRRWPEVVERVDSWVVRAARPLLQ